MDLEWVTFVNSFGANLYTYGKFPNDTGATLLSVIHQNSLSSFEIKSVPFENGLITFRSVSDKKSKDSIFLFSIIIFSKNNHSHHEALIDLIFGLLKLRLGQIEYQTVHDEKDIFRNRVEFLNHILGQLPKFMMELYVPYPQNHLLVSQKFNHSVVDINGDDYGSFPLAIIYKNKFLMGNDAWNSTSYKDKKLLELFIRMNPKCTARDVPVFYDEGKKGARLITVKLTQDYEFFMLLGSKPTMHYIYNYLSNNDIKDALKAKDSYEVLDENIIEFLFIHHKKSFFFHEKKEEHLKNLLPKTFHFKNFQISHQKYIYQGIKTKDKEIYCISKKPVDLKDYLSITKD